jgi:hypothetical protein
MVGASERLSAVEEVWMRNIRTWGVVLAAILGTFTIVLLALVLWPGGREDTAMADMTPGDSAEVAIPPVDGFYGGEEILFIHSEASDEQVVEMMAGMMDSPVILVPELATLPETALANVYVFTNGVTPEDALGLMGFQPDVFDSAPGDENYSPLRSANLVTWTDETSARLLTSVEEIVEAEEQGELTIEQPGIVVNMPFLTWPGGQR